MPDRTRLRLLDELKNQGPMAAADLAKALSVTAVAVRQHLDGLLEDGLVTFEDHKRGVGRPRRVWTLSAAGHARFPDAHANLALKMLEGVRSLFGEDGVEKIIAFREASLRSTYSKALAGKRSLKDKVHALAEARAAEGYMAEVSDVGDAFVLAENHCSICAAAKACTGLCMSELAVFRGLLGDDVQVDRVEHLMTGGRRCVYRIAPMQKAKVAA